MDAPPRPHPASRAADGMHRLLGRLLTPRGWSPVVTASTGYADADGVHVFLRVLLVPGRRRHPAPDPVRAHARRGWRSFLTLPAPGTAVVVTVDGGGHAVEAGRGGYVHAELPTVLPPGWHEASAAVPGGAAVSFRVRAVDPTTTRGVVSDIDDTILVTWLPRPLLAFWNTFVLREHARRPVPGMAPLLRSLVGDDGFMVYLSTGAWNFAAHLERFIAEHGYPPGPLLLTDWGPTDTGWFRSGARHKRDMLERLHREHPTVRWTLVGDDGQRDPVVYRAFAEDFPHAVDAVAIRRLTATQQVLTSGTPSAAAPAAPTDGTTPVRWATGTDGDELAAALRGLGVLPGV